MMPKSQTPRRLPPRRLLQGVAYTVIGMTALLLCLPLVIAQGLRYNLLQFGAGAVEVDNVDLNLFSGRLAIDGVRIYQSAAEVFSLGHAELIIDLGALFERRLHLRRLTLSRLSLTLDEPDPTTWRVAGFALPPLPAEGRSAAGTAQPGWGVGLNELRIENARIDFIRPGLASHITITQATLADALSWQGEQPSRFRLAARFEQSQLDLSGQATPFAASPAAEGRLHLEAFPLASLRPLLPPNLVSLQGQLSSELALKLEQSGEQQQFTAEGSVRLNGVGVDSTEMNLRSRQLTWAGTSRLLLQPKRMALSLNGQLENHQLALHSAEFELNDSSFRWRGESRLSARGETLALTLIGKAENEQLTLTLPAQAVALHNDKLDWEGTASLDAVHRPEDLKSEGKLRLSGLEAAPLEGKPYASLATAEVNAIAVNGVQDIAVGTVALTSLVANVRRTRQGIILLPGSGKTAAAAPSTKGTDVMQGEKGQAAPRLRLDRLTLGGSNRIDFSDETVRPRYQQRVRISKASLSALDSAQPDHPSPFEVAGKVGQYGSLALSGTVRPFGGALGLALNAQLRNADVPPLSPYLAQLLGYKATSGQLDTKLELKIDNNAMAGVARITLNQLELEPEDPARIEDFEKKLSLPLNTALSLLRDSDNNIQLKLPVSGKLDDPRFDLSDAINTALGKAMRVATLSYLKNLFQPYSTVISVIQLAGSVGGRIQLDPLRFEAGSAAPLSEMQPYMERLGELLQNRSALRLRLCGKATLADLNTLSQGKEKTIPAAGHEALEALARMRGENIKAILVEGYGIDAGRLFVCHPELDRSAEGIPRLELQL